MLRDLYQEKQKCEYEVVKNIVINSPEAYVGQEDMETWQLYCEKNYIGLKCDSITVKAMDRILDENGITADEKAKIELYLSTRMKVISY